MWDLGHKGGLILGARSEPYYNKWGGKYTWLQKLEDSWVPVEAWGVLS